MCFSTMDAIELKEYLVSYISPSSSSSPSSPSGNQRNAIIVAESKADARRTVQNNEGIDTEFVTIIEVDGEEKVWKTDGKRRKRKHCLVFRKSIGHDILGWHDCDETGFDGASATGTCKYCGKKCLQDSQGNWF